MYREDFEVFVDKETYHYRLETSESGSFTYGNGLLLEVFCNGRREQLVDIRYEREIVDAESFRAWAEAWMRSYCRSDCVIRRVEKEAVCTA